MPIPDNLKSIPFFNAPTIQSDIFTAKFIRFGLE